MNDLIQHICPHLDRTLPGKPCRYYDGHGMCLRNDHFRCMEYVAAVEVPLDYSRHFWQFMRCDYGFYLSEILGWERRHELLPVKMRQGSYMHECLAHLAAGLDAPDPYQFLNAETEQRNITNVDVLLYAMKKLNLIPKGIPEYPWYSDKYDMLRLYGTIDLLDLSKPPRWFREYKYGEDPYMYMNSLFAQTQLATYMLAVPTLDHCYISPIRVPKLRGGNDEDDNRYAKRLLADILDRPSFYFPYYDQYQSGSGLWGKRYFAERWDLEGLKLKYRESALDIQRRLHRGYWPQRECNCLIPTVCQFHELCTTSGEPSELFYVRREKKDTYPYKHQGLEVIQ